MNLVVLSCDSSLRVFCSPCDRLSFGVLDLILASSNSTSSRKVSRAIEGWTDVSQSDLTGMRFFIVPVKYVLEVHSSEVIE